MTSRRLDGRRRVAAIAAFALVVVVAAVPIGAAQAAVPVLPIADDRGFLGNLTSPTLAPGGSGTISFTVGDPLAVPISSVELTFALYAFNGFPGNATGPIPVAAAPALANATASGASVGVGLGTLAPYPSAPARASVAVVTSASTPSGAFAVRTALSFVANGTEYRLESRGWFNASTWAAATTLPNGSATLNLTVLGVSGVVPETAIIVAESSYPWILAGVLAGAAVFVGVGAYVYFRRSAPSRSGTRIGDSDDHQAPRAFGKRRTRDGD